MRALISIFKMRFQLLIQYRIAAIAGIVTQLFFGIVIIMIFVAFFKGNESDQPMTLAQTVSYIWLGQGLLGLMPWNGDREVQGMIRSGDIAYELIRPMALYDYWLFRILAQRLASTSLRAIPVFVIAFLLPEPYGLMGPASRTGMICFTLTMVGAILLGAALSNILTLSALFIIGDGMDRIFPALVIFFSGMVIPIAFFPDWSQVLFRILPFSGVADAPYRFYIGTYGLNNLMSILIHQLVWFCGLVVFGKWLVTCARKRIVIQGG